MISIIICSREQTISSDLYENIKDTIGCKYELIVIDNTKNQYSIFEAYNLGIKKSVGDYLCFMHDDILLHTNSWGAMATNIFKEDKQVGLIGVAGSKTLSKMPAAWWDCREEEKILNLIQHFKDKDTETWNLGFEDSSNTEAVVIDGVFMVMRRDERILFDERLKGFHNYDLFLSLKHHMLNKKVLVTSEILLEHFSEGSLCKAWYQSSSLFHKLYKNYLPVAINDEYKNEHLKKTEFKFGQIFITKLIEQKLYLDAIYWWFEMFKLKPKAKFHYRFWKRILKNI